MSAPSAQTKIRFRKGSRINGDPNRINAELRQIEREQGSLNASAIVSAVRSNPSLYISRYFTKDRDKAAIKCWMEEARKLLQSIEVYVVFPKEGKTSAQPVRYWVEGTKKSGDYRAIQVVMSSKEEREVLLQNAFDELQAFVRKYEVLEELAGIVKVIKKFKLKK